MDYFGPLRLIAVGAMLTIALYEMRLVTQRPYLALRWVVALLGLQAALLIFGRYYQGVAHTDNQVFWAFQFQHFVGLALVPTGMWFGQLMRGPLTKGNVVILLVGIAGAATPFVRTWVFLPELVTITDLTGDTLEVARFQPWYTHFELVYSSLGVGYMIYMARNGERFDRLNVLVMTVGCLVALPAFNDVFMQQGFITSIRLHEWGLAIEALVAAHLVNYRTVMTIGDLQGAVRARTEELETQSRELSRALGSVRDLIDGIPDMVIVYADDTVLFSNQTARQKLGYEDQPFPQSFASLVQDGDVHQMRSLGGAHDAGTMGELVFLRRGAESFSAEVASVPLVFDGVEAHVAIARDLSEQEEWRKQLRQSERLASIGTLAAGVAHEINNPLAYVVGNLEAVRLDIEELALDGESRAEILEMLSDASDGATRVADIVRDLRVFSQTRDDECGPVSLESCFETALSLAQNQVRHRAQVTSELTGLPPVLAEEGRLIQVLVNLLVNAAQSIEEKGEFGTIEVVARESGKMIVVEVRDDGTGVPVEAMSKILDPFFTTKAVGRGTGLGLSICHGIVASFGGTLAIHNREEQGAVVRLELLQAQGEVPAPSAELRRPPALQGRILVVDDNASVAKVLVRLLRDCEVRVAASAAEARNAIREQDFDAILCDVMMPEEDGLSLWDSLRGQHLELAERCVFMTGGVFSKELEDRLSANECPTLAKPIDRNELFETLQIAMARGTGSHVLPA